MSTVRSRPRIGLLLAILLPCLFLPGAGESVLGCPSCPGDALLREIMAEMEVSETKVLSEERYGLANLRRLADLPLTEARATESLVLQDWMEEFRKGEIGATAAVRGEGGLAAAIGSVAPEPLGFATRFYAAPAADRVFLAFTKADAPFADAVARAMDRRGFEVFTYLKPGASAAVPWTTGQVVGWSFNTAGNHLVIDSGSARSSPGIQMEYFLKRGLVTAAELESLRREARERERQVKRVAREGVIALMPDGEVTRELRARIRARQQSRRVRR